MRYAIVFLLLVFLGGCGTPTDIETAAVDARTDQASYNPGDEGLLIIKNESGATVQVKQASEKSGICGIATFQVRTENEWVSYPSGCVRIMILRFVKLGRGDSLTVPFHAAGFEPGGEYRFVVVMRDPSTGERSLRYSTSFGVAE